MTDEPRKGARFGNRNALKGVLKRDARMSIVLPFSVKSRLQAKARAQGVTLNDLANEAIELFVSE